jgi:hypothetical protein
MTMKKSLALAGLLMTLSVQTLAAYTTGNHCFLVPDWNRLYITVPDTDIPLTSPIAQYQIVKVYEYIVYWNDHSNIFGFDSKYYTGVIDARDDGSYGSMRMSRPRTKDLSSSNEVFQFYWDPDSGMTLDIWTGASLIREQPASKVSCSTYLID